MTTKRKRATKRKRNPAESKALSSARRLSKAFHGRTEVVELSAKERKPLPKYMVVLGDLETLTYAPDKRSKKGNYVWEHKSGDRGFLKRRSKNKPLVVIDPKNRKPAILLNRSPMKLTERGLVG